MSDSLDVFTVCVNARTTWIFFKLSGASGGSGIGEATVSGRTAEMLQAIPTAIQACNSCKLGLGAKLDTIRAACAAPVGQAIASGLEQTWLDRLAKSSDLPLHVILGGRYRESIPIYANINRGTHSRKPEEFALRAQAAVDKGYRAIKLAPFDEVTPEVCSEPKSKKARLLLVQKAYERVAAVSEQVGKSAELKVDCHSRLRVAEVAETIDRMAALGVTWFEEPVREMSDNIKHIALIRQHANACGILLAGAEKSSSLSAFTKWMHADCYDVVMPDIILAGGLTEVVRIGHMARVMNCDVSLHNPCGPLMDAMSAQVAAALPSLHSLERQYDESPLYDEVIERENNLCDGELSLIDESGAGCTIDTSHPMVKHVASYAIAL